MENSTRLETEWEQRWELWKTKNNDYEKFIQALNVEFGGYNQDMKFLSTHAPWYLTGNWQEDTEKKLFICGLNPGAKESKNWHNKQLETTGFKKNQNDREKHGFKETKDFALNCFKLASNEGFTHRHFTEMAQFAYHFFKKPIHKSRKERYTFLHENVVFGDLIPYYSSKTTISKANSKSLNPFWDIMLDFILKYRFQAVLFMDRQFLNEDVLERLQVSPLKGLKGYEIEITSKETHIQGIISPFLRNWNYHKMREYAEILQEIAEKKI